MTCNRWSEYNGKCGRLPTGQGRHHSGSVFLLRDMGDDSILPSHFLNEKGIEFELMPLISSVFHPLRAKMY